LTPPKASLKSDDLTAESAFKILAVGFWRGAEGSGGYSQLYETQFRGERV